MHAWCTWAGARVQARRYYYSAWGGGCIGVWYSHISVFAFHRFRVARRPLSEGRWLLILSCDRIEIWWEEFTSISNWIFTNRITFIDKCIWNSIVSMRFREVSDKIGFGKGITINTGHRFPRTVSDTMVVTGHIQPAYWLRCKQWRKHQSVGFPDRNISYASVKASPDARVGVGFIYFGCAHVGTAGLPKDTLPHKMCNLFNWLCMW